MEKLILRSVMYGADKIPDSWFEKVPGGFYKPSQKASQKTDSRQKSGGGDSAKKHRRYSHDHDEGRRGRRDRYDDGQRTEDIRRQERRGRSSCDGSHDDDHGRGDRGKIKGGGGRRRHHSVDSSRYGYDSGYGRARNNAYYGDRKYNSRKQTPPPDPYFDDRQRPVAGTGGDRRGTTAAAVAGGGLAAATAAAEEGAPYPQTRSNSIHATKMPSPRVQPAQTPGTDQPRSSSIKNSYVPYAHIYGQNDARPQPAFPPPPQSSFIPAQPGTTDRYAPAASGAPQSYQQNSIAQQAPPAGLAGSAADNAPSRSAPQPAPQTGSARAFVGYDESNPPYPATSRSARSTHKYSPSSDRYSRHDSNVRRARSEHRPDKSDRKGRDRGRDTYVDPRAPLRSQLNVPPPPPGLPPGSKDTRRDSAHDRDYRHSYRPSDRGYTSD